MMQLIFKYHGEKYINNNLEYYMNKNYSEIYRLTEQDVPEIVDVLCNSFADYPVMLYVLNSEINYNHRLKVLINFFVMARIFREEAVIGIGDGANLTGVALTSNPDNSLVITELNELREKVWAELGPESRSRYQNFGDTCAQFKVTEPHIHLNMIGVRTEAQGNGLAGKLMEAVHLLSKSDPNSKGVTLTTEDPEKVSFYKYMGYKIIGEAMVTPKLKTWGFFRPD
ncbi:MAG: GNAT family N-acetyltransferase [Ignavibacteria bacterium]|jgi:ribosomal protein S18 acetylase RimI-like enzyme